MNDSRYQPNRHGAWRRRTDHGNWHSCLRDAYGRESDSASFRSGSRRNRRASNEAILTALWAFGAVLPRLRPAEFIPPLGCPRPLPLQPVLSTSSSDRRRLQGAGRISHPVSGNDSASSDVAASRKRSCRFARKRPRRWCHDVPQ
jgi:hypothetical protein